jgi:uncharacterized protein (DUF58 family)
MNMMIDEHELERRIAIQKGTDALKQLRAAFDRASRDLAQYEARYEQADALQDKAQVLNWALNLVSTGVLPNARLDLTACAQAELHAIARHKDRA